MKTIQISVVRLQIHKLLSQAADLIDQATELEESLLNVIEASRSQKVEEVKVKPKKELHFTPMENTMWNSILQVFRNEGSIITRKDICQFLWNRNTIDNKTLGERLLSVLDKAEKMGFITVNKTQKAFTYSLTPLTYRTI